jgi:hypothetical protein
MNPWVEISTPPPKTVFNSHDERSFLLWLRVEAQFNNQTKQTVPAYVVLGKCIWLRKGRATLIDPSRETPPTKMLWEDGEPHYESYPACRLVAASHWMAVEVPQT